MLPVVRRLVRETVWPVLGWLTQQLSLGLRVSLHLRKKCVALGIAMEKIRQCRQFFRLPWR
jgi:hypothetical protein